MDLFDDRLVGAVLALLRIGRVSSHRERLSVNNKDNKDNNDNKRVSK